MGKHTNMFVLTVRAKSIVGYGEPVSEQAHHLYIYERGR